MADVDAVTNEREFRDIIIPMIRKTLPSLMANDIVGVQPMTGPSGLIFSMKAKYGTKSVHRSWSYDDWVDGCGIRDTAEHVRIYIEGLLDD